MASSSKEQELAIKIAGKVENSFKQSLGVTEDGLNKIASVAKKAAAVAAAAFAAVKVGDFISGRLMSMRNLNRQWQTPLLSQGHLRTIMRNCLLRPEKQVKRQPSRLRRRPMPWDIWHWRDGMWKKVPQP